MLKEKFMFRIQLRKTVACLKCVVKIESNGPIVSCHNYTVEKSYRKLQNGLSASVLLTHIISLVHLLLHIYSAICQHCLKELSRRVSEPCSYFKWWQLFLHDDLSMFGRAPVDLGISSSMNYLHGGSSTWYFRLD